MKKKNEEWHSICLCVTVGIGLDAVKLPDDVSVLLLLEFGSVNQNRVVSSENKNGREKRVFSQLTSAGSQSRPIPRLPSHPPTASCLLHPHLLRPILSKA